MSKKTIAILLAAGKGTRMKNPSINKTATLLHDKPLIEYAVDCVKKISAKTIVVVGFQSDSVKQALVHQPVTYVHQRLRLGTGHAVRVAIDSIPSADLASATVIVGNGDHMVFYTEDIIEQIVSHHDSSRSTVTVVTTVVNNPAAYDNGRIIRREDFLIERIIERKELSPSLVDSLSEVNCGLYCFSGRFLLERIHTLKKSPISGEYYLTDLINLAAENNLAVSAFPVSLEVTGIGINTPEHLRQVEQLLEAKEIHV